MSKIARPPVGSSWASPIEVMVKPVEAHVKKLNLHFLEKERPLVVETWPR